MREVVRKVDEDAVKEFNETSPNWTATCRLCHVSITGTLTELRSHVCEVNHGK